MFPNKNNKITFTDKIIAKIVLRFFPKKVTPNHITMFRFFLVPFVFFSLWFDRYALGAGFLIVAVLSDAIDGALARTTNQITEWGQVFDPAADKFLIGSTALALIPKYLHHNIAIVIIFIEMIFVAGSIWKKIVAKRGGEIQANKWGKTKMILQSVGLLLVIFYGLAPFPFILTIAEYVLYGAIGFAIISLVTGGA